MTTKAGKIIVEKTPELNTPNSTKRSILDQFSTASSEVNRRGHTSSHKERAIVEMVFIVEVILILHSAFIGRMQYAV